VNSEGVDGILKDAYNNLDIVCSVKASWWAINSVARVLPSHGRSHWFESSIAHRLASALENLAIDFDKENWREDVRAFIEIFRNSLPIPTEPAFSQRRPHSQSGCHRSPGHGGMG
jgi:hypothetical protein